MYFQIALIPAAGMEDVSEKNLTLVQLNSIV